MMAYPDKINALVDVSADETLAAGGHAARHNDVNEALEEVRDVLGGGSPITTTATRALELKRDGQVEVTFTRYTSNSASSLLIFQKGRGTEASPSVVSENDNLGQIVWRGYSSAADDFLNAGVIRVQVDSEPDSSGDTTDMPGRLEFQTTPNGSSSPLERMRINNAGAVLIGTTTPGSASTGDLVVNGGVFLGGSAAANELDDYEEGTWTPQIADEPSGGNQTTTGTGVYTKVGRLVTVQFQITDIDTTGLGAGATWVQGLPFTVATGPGLGSVGSAVLDKVSFSGYVSAIAYFNTSACLLRDSRTGTTDTTISAGNFTSGSADINPCTITYYTA